MSRSIPFLPLPAQLLAAGALACLLLAPCGGAQAGDDEASRQVRRYFLEGLAAETREDRIEAVRTLELSGLPESLPLMQEGLDAVLRRHGKRYARYVTIGRRASDATRTRPAVSSKARALAAERSKLAVQLDDDERLIAALRGSMGRAFLALSPADQGRALGTFAARLERMRSRDARLELLETLGHFKSAGACRLLQPFATSPDALIRLTVVEALGRQGATAAMLALAKALEDPCWQVQAMAIDAISNLGGVVAVDTLIRALGRVDGRLRQDVSFALVKLTGEDFHLNPLLWRRWWRAHKSDYRGPPEPRAVDTAGDAEGAKQEPDATARAWRSRTEGTSFYGIHTNSKRVVYVLDLSNSMNDPVAVTRATVTPAPTARPTAARKIDQALRQLRDSIAALPDDARFDIVLYNHEVHAWRTSLISASREHKRQADAWTETLRASGNTNVFDAIERAFALSDRAPATTGPAVPADTIFLLSDGRANRGRVTDGDEMRREVRRLNRRRGAVIHTVALGANADLAFMKGLAEDTGGQSVHIGGER